MISRALISVYDKSGLDEFAQGLADLGVEIVSSGGTSAYLEGLGFIAILALGILYAWRKRALEYR